MATTIIKTPQPFQPTRSDGLFFTVSADTATQPKFRFVYEVYVDGYLVFEGKSTPNPYGIGLIDLSRILDNYVVNYPVSYYIDEPIFTHQTGVFSKPYGNEVIEYYIKVGEEYSNSFVGSVSGYTGIGTQIGFPGVPSNTFKTFLSTMGVNRNSTLENFNIGQFTLSGNPQPAFPKMEDGLFLTNSPRIRDIDLSEYYTLSFTNGDLGSPYLSTPYYVEFRFYDENGWDITAHTYSNIVLNGGGPATACTDTYSSFSSSDFTEYNILNVGVGPKNIFNFPANTKYYQVQLYGASQNVTPTPTPTKTSTPTPTPTINLTPSQTPTYTSTPTTTQTPSATLPEGCYTYEVMINDGTSNRTSYNLYWDDCAGLPTSRPTVNLGTYYICSSSQGSISGDYIVAIEKGSSCGTPSVTPSMTPTMTPSGAGSGVSGTTLNITDTGWIKYTDNYGVTQYVQATSLGTFTINNCHDCASIAPGIPFADLASWDVKVCGSNCSTPSVTPSVTPSATPAAYIACYIRDCCTGTQTFQVWVDSSLSVGNVIVIGGQCYQIYALGGNGSGGDYRGAENFLICNECLASYPCTTTPPNPAVVKPNVQPTTFVVTGGTAPCVEYAPVSEIFQFNVVDKCNPFGNEQIMFKNRYGVWDYFFFTRARIEGVGIQRESYGQFNTTWGSSSPMKTNYSRGLTEFQTSMSETHIVNSGFLNDPEFIWLEELYTSNDVYLIEQDGGIFPINIVSTEFVKKTKGNRQIVNIELTYTYSNNLKLLNG